MDHDLGETVVKQLRTCGLCGSRYEARISPDSKPLDHDGPVFCSGCACVAQQLHGGRKWDEAVTVERIAPEPEEQDEGAYTELAGAEQPESDHTQAVDARISEAPELETDRKSFLESLLPFMEDAEAARLGPVSQRRPARRLAAPAWLRNRKLLLPVMRRLMTDRRGADLGYSPAHSLWYAYMYWLVGATLPEIAEGLYARTSHESMCAEELQSSVSRLENVLRRFRKRG